MRAKRAKQLKRLAYASSDKKESTKRILKTNGMHRWDDDCPKGLYRDVKVGYRKLNYIEKG